MSEEKIMVIVLCVSAAVVLSAFVALTVQRIRLGIMMRKKFERDIDKIPRIKGW